MGHDVFIPSTRDACGGLELGRPIEGGAGRPQPLPQPIRTLVGCIVVHVSHIISHYFGTGGGVEPRERHRPQRVVRRAHSVNAACPTTRPPTPPLNGGGHGAGTCRFLKQLIPLVQSPVSSDAPRKTNGV